jgi:hypothetical protein
MSKESAFVIRDSRNTEESNNVCPPHAQNLDSIETRKETAFVRLSRVKGDAKPRIALIPTLREMRTVFVIANLALRSM